MFTALRWHLEILQYQYRDLRQPQAVRKSFMLMLC